VTGGERRRFANDAVVIAGLDPAIHRLAKNAPLSARVMDLRVKPARDMGARNRG